MPGRGAVDLFRRFQHSCRAFRRDRRGSTAVEFSLIVVPFLGLLFAIFQTAYVLLIQGAIDAAAKTAGRNIMTGQTMASNTTDVSTFRSNVICPSLPSYVTCSSLIVDVRTSGSSGSTSWSGGSTGADFLNTTTKFCIGNPGDIVIVRIIFPVPAYLSIATISTTLKSVTQATSGQSLQTSTGNMVYPVMGITAFKNEPFTASTYSFPSGC